MRIRICGQYDEQIEKYEEEMQSIALRLGEQINNYGFMEAEFVIDDKGKIYLLEVNPRVSGTLRIAALASDTKCFNLLFKSTIRENKLEAKYNTYEIPYRGRGFFDEKNDIYVTSRATFAAKTDSEIENKLRSLNETEITLSDVMKQREGILSNY